MSLYMNKVTCGKIGFKEDLTDNIYFVITFIISNNFDWMFVIEYILLYA